MHRGRRSWLNTTLQIRLRYNPDLPTESIYIALPYTKNEIKMYSDSAWKLPLCLSRARKMCMCVAISFYLMFALYFPKRSRLFIEIGVASHSSPKNTTFQLLNNNKKTRQNLDRFVVGAMCIKRIADTVHHYIIRVHSGRVRTSVRTFDFLSQSVRWRQVDHFGCSIVFRVIGQTSQWIEGYWITHIKALWSRVHSFGCITCV